MDHHQPPFTGWPGEHCYYPFAPGIHPPFPAFYGPPQPWLAHPPTQDPSGWYTRPVSPSSFMPPPGLPPPAAPHLPTPSASSLPSPGESTLHDFWKGRFAPMPGFASRPGLVPIRENQRLKISDPTQRPRASSQMQLLPPQSFMAIPGQVGPQVQEITNDSGPKVCTISSLKINSHRIQFSHFNSINMYVNGMKLCHVLDNFVTGGHIRTSVSEGYSKTITPTSTPPICTRISSFILSPIFSAATSC